jgi:hypothetical protein
MKLQIFWCCVKKKKKKKKKSIYYYQIREFLCIEEKTLSSWYSKINKYNKPGERKHSSHMVSDGSHIFYI